MNESKKAYRVEEVTAEEIASEMSVLLKDVFEGEIVTQGDKMLYTLPGGETFEIAVKKISQ